MPSRINGLFEYRLPIARAVAYDLGALVDGEQNSVNTVTVHSGHGINTGDKFLYALGERNIIYARVFTAGTVTATTVPFAGDPWSFPDGSLLVPLEADTGGTQNDDGSFQLPNWDGSTITMTSDGNGDDTIASVIVQPTGEAGFWASTVPIWLIGLDNGNKPIQVLLDLGLVAGTVPAGQRMTRGTSFPVSPTLGDQHLLTVGGIDILYTYMATTSGNDWVEGVSAP